jgi:hypothetical protein
MRNAHTCHHMRQVRVWRVMEVAMLARHAHRHARTHTRVMHAHALRTHTRICVPGIVRVAEWVIALTALPGQCLDTHA